MTIFQLVPAYLHGTFFFKVIQGILKQLPSTDLEAIKLFKHAIFMILHVETSTLDFSSKLNEHLRDIHEELIAGSQIMTQLAKSSNLYTADA